MSKKIRATDFNINGKSKSKKVMAGDCIFPFIYNDKVHTKCVKSSKGAWCATKVNKGREMTKFGYCESDLRKIKLPESNNRPLLNNANIKRRMNNRNNNNKVKK